MDPNGQRTRRLAAASGYIDLNMPDHALRELDAILTPLPDKFEFYRLRGEALRAAGRHEEALGCYGLALGERPKDLGVLMGMAWCYKRTDQLPKAIAAMEEAYRAHPKEPIVLYNIACYYSLGGEKAQALAWLGRALRMEGGLRRLIADETDFDRLRNDPDFQYVTGMQYGGDR